jgi:translocation and assembly module TamA
MKKWLFFPIFFFASGIIFALPVLLYKINGLAGAEKINAINRLEAKLEPYKESLNDDLILRLSKRGSTEILRAIEPYGHFAPTITYKTSVAKNVWTTTYTVNPGRALRITDLTIQWMGEGKNNPLMQQIVAQLPIKENDVFNVDNYSKAKDLLINQLQKEGYLEAKLIDDVVRVHLLQYTSSVELLVDTGPRFYFGPIRFSKTPLSTELLNRYLTFRPGEYFSYPKILKTQENLNGSAYFQGISIPPSKEETKNRYIPVDINLVMNKQNSYIFGLGYGTYTGARGSIGYQRRWLNPYGHSFNSQIKLSQKEQSLAAQYRIPGKKPWLDQYFISAGAFRILPQSGESDVISLGIGQIKTLGKWQYTAAFNILQERFRIDDTDPFTTSTLLMPTVSFTHTATDNTLNPTNGHRISFMFSGSAKQLLSTVSFFQAETRYKWIRTFWQNNRLILMGDVGYTTVSDLNNFPLSKQFYAGGIDSVRGYAYQELGPGRYLAEGTIEYQRRIYGEIYGAVFYDMGNAMNNWNTALKKSIGIGAVWQSPVGALRFYLGRAIHDDDEHNIIFTFSLGPEL